ncbi:trypsin-like peptidase domain-containing protein [Propionibacteriaceae bacterium Y1685]
MTDPRYGQGPDPDQRLGPWGEEPVRPAGPPRTGQSAGSYGQSAGSAQANPFDNPSASSAPSSVWGDQPTVQQSGATVWDAGQAHRQPSATGQPSAAQPAAGQPATTQPSAAQSSHPQTPASGETAATQMWSRGDQQDHGTWGTPAGSAPGTATPGTTGMITGSAVPGPGSNSGGGDTRPTNPWGDYPEHRGSDGHRAHPTATFPPPPGVPQVQPRAAQSVNAPATQYGQQSYAQPAPYQSPTNQRRGPGWGATILIALLSALLVGAAAGVGGSVLGATLLRPAQPDPSTPGDPTPEQSVPPEPGSVTAVAEKMLPSTVMIRVKASNGTSTGSGFVLDAEGRIMTNNHVIDLATQGGDMTVEFHDGSQVAAELVGRSPSYDIGIIQVDPQEVAELVPSELGDSEAMKVGDPVVAIGSPLGLNGTVTEGIVSAKERPVSVGSEDNPSYINALQTDASINPGNSGGPLIDAAGRVIGVNSAILTIGGSEGQRSGSVGLGFAIPIKEARAVGEEIIATGQATSPTIGAVVKPEGDGRGARIDSFSSGSPAQEAGLQEGDVVTAVDDRPVADHVELIVAIRSHRPGDVVTLHHTRNGVPAETQVTLGEQEG